MPSCENINMQGKIKSTGHRGSCLYLYMGRFLLYPWACIILQKGRHKDTSLDKLILVLAIIYTYHDVLFFPFPDITLHIFPHYLCCYQVVQNNSTLGITTPYLSSTSLFFFLLHPLMTGQLKLRANHIHTSLS